MAGEIEFFVRKVDTGQMHVLDKDDLVKILGDIVISTSGSGYCINDELDGKVYRITCENGILVTTEVVE